MSMTKKKTKAYSYVRFSTPEQAAGDSLRRQLELSQKYAEENNLELDEKLNLSDKGVSAFRGANLSEGSALSRFMALVEAGQIEPGSVLLVESLDRLSRQTLTKALPPFLRIIASGIEIVTLQDRQRYSESSMEGNNFQLLASLLHMIRANEESETKSKRICAAWRQKQSNAEKGEVLTKVVPGWLRVIETGKKRTLEIIPQNVAVVQRIFDLSATGFGQAAIAKLLTIEGQKRFDDEFGWYPTSIGKILNSRSVLGEYQPHKRIGHGKRAPCGDIIPTYYPKIIDDTKFLAAQACRKQRRNKGGRPSGEIRTLFPHLIRCAHCGGSVVFKSESDHRHPGYLLCSNARLGKKCVQKSWRYEVVENLFLEWIVDFDFTRTQPNDLLLAIENKILSEEANVLAIQTKIGNLVEAIADGGSKSLGKKISALEVELESASERLNTARQDRVRTSADDANMRQNALTFQNLIIAAKDIGNRKRLLQEIRSRVENIRMIFDGDKIPVYLTRFMRVSLKNGQQWDLSDNGDVILYDAGKKLEVTRESDTNAEADTAA